MVDFNNLSDRLLNCFVFFILGFFGFKILLVLK